MARNPGSDAMNPGPGPSWRNPCRVGGAAKAPAIPVLVLSVVTSAPPAEVAAMLEQVAARRSTWIARQVPWIAPNLLMSLALLALTVALVPLGKSFGLVAVVVAISPGR